MSVSRFVLFVSVGENTYNYSGVDPKIIAQVRVYVSLERGKHLTGNSLLTALTENSLLTQFHVIPVNHFNREGSLLKKSLTHFNEEINKEMSGT